MTLSQKQICRCSVINDFRHDASLHNDPNTHQHFAGNKACSPKSSRDFYCDFYCDFCFRNNCSMHCVTILMVQKNTMQKSIHRLNFRIQSNFGLLIFWFYCQWKSSRFYALKVCQEKKNILGLIMLQMVIKYSSTCNWIWFCHQGHSNICFSHERFGVQWL